MEDEEKRAELRRGISNKSETKTKRTKSSSTKEPLLRLLLTPRLNLNMTMNRMSSSKMTTTTNPFQPLIPRIPFSSFQPLRKSSRRRMRSRRSVHPPSTFDSTASTNESVVSSSFEEIGEGASNGGFDGKHGHEGWTSFSWEEAEDGVDAGVVDGEERGRSSSGGFGWVRGCGCSGGGGRGGSSAVVGWGGSCSSSNGCWFVDVEVAVSVGSGRGRRGNESDGSLGELVCELLILSTPSCSFRRKRRRRRTSRRGSWNSSDVLELSDGSRSRFAGRFRCWSIEGEDAGIHLLRRSHHVDSKIRWVGHRRDFESHSHPVLLPLLLLRELGSSFVREGTVGVLDGVVVCWFRGEDGRVGGLGRVGRKPRSVRLIWNSYDSVGDSVGDGGGDG